jgi:glycosyltransferase involved in cell wall biosynthesis
VSDGDYVEWFSSTFPGAPRQELIDGVRIVRGGRQWTVHWQAFKHYRRRLRDQFDVIIDETNTIPFFTPLWSRIPSILLIHQLAREVWWYESPFPVNAIGFALEPFYLRLYRDLPAITVSQSTRDDLVRLGFRNSITVLPQGLEQTTGEHVERSTLPEFLYVGRLAPSKRVDDLIRALALFNGFGFHGRLKLIGDGDPRYVRQLRRLATLSGVGADVEFLGRVATSIKHRELASACALLLASVREGWGLVVTEANAFGTPAIGYNVPGLRDSIRDGTTGLLVTPSPRSLADAMSRLWADRALYMRLSSAASEWSRSFTYEASYLRLRQQLLAIVEKHQTSIAPAAVGN